MRFDAAKLRKWRLPRTFHRLEPRDVAFYALSVGLGQDPLDTKQHRFVDPYSAELQPLPSAALVMAYPGFWLGDFRTGIDASRVLHVEQSLEVLDYLPICGDLSSETRVLDLLDLGPSRGALLYSERLIFEGERPFARLTQTHILRANGGFSERIDSPDKPIPVANDTPLFTGDFQTRPEQALFYRLNGDSNRIHLDPDVATEAGLPKPILHGMCTFGLITHALVRLACNYDADRIRRMSLRFTGPVFPGDKLRVEIHGNYSFRAFANDRPVIDYGHALVA